MRIDYLIPEHFQFRLIAFGNLDIARAGIFSFRFRIARLPNALELGFVGACWGS